ncbi:hypothetical protein FN846DRAFT_893674 [Sphaerosporella brunnea]|uniref:Uncharacterized protein n=1 Tax=Sphaerosporella brunnea TaxID=1250544 RepID=A0A5J5ELA3_9PEZI|nr:hypothetical protein FN846DRAFT_893674 [Sphaerosporella brunnea]
MRACYDFTLKNSQPPTVTRDGGPRNPNSNSPYADDLAHTPDENEPVGNGDVVQDDVDDHTRDENQLVGNADVVQADDFNSSSAEPQLVDEEVVQDDVDHTPDENELVGNGDVVQADDFNRSSAESNSWMRRLSTKLLASTICPHSSRGFGPVGMDRSQRWVPQSRTPGSRDVIYGRNEDGEPAGAAGRNASSRDVSPRPVQKRKGLTRKIQEPLEGAQISITSIEGDAAPRTHPKDKARREKLTPRFLDFVARWSKTAKTPANESSSPAVVAYSMDGLLLLDMPGGEESGARPAETRMINTTNMEVLATLDAFHCGKVSRSFSRSPAVKFVLDTLKRPGVRVLVATVVRDTDVGNPKAIGPLQDRFLRQPAKRA